MGDSEATVQGNAFEGAYSFAGALFSIKDHMQRDNFINGIVTTEVLGTDGKPKILRYSSKKLVKYTALGTLLANGTVFTMDTTALKNVVVQLFVLLMTAAVTICINLHDLSQLKSLDFKGLQQLSSITNQLVPFCLAYYVSLSLNRWWALRVDALGKVFDAFENVAMLVSGELHDKKWQDLRNLLEGKIT